MKYSILLATLLASLSVQAADPLAVPEKTNFAHIQYTLRDTVAGQAGETNRQGVNFTVGHNFNKNLQIDLGQQFRTGKFNEDNNGGTSSNRLEAGATYSYDLLPSVSLYTRGAIGYKLTDNQDFGYYSVEPGVRATVMKNLTARVGYRYRDSFSQAYFDKTNTVRVALQYDLNKESFLSAGLDRAYGDSEFIGLNLGYGVKF